MVKWRLMAIGLLGAMVAAGCAGQGASRAVPATVPGAPAAAIGPGAVGAGAGKGAPAPAPAEPAAGQGAGSAQFGVGAAPLAAPAEPAAGDGGGLPVRPAPRHVDVRGLYMTAYTAGIEEWLREMVTFARAKGLNAFVIDAMDDDGRISWQTDIPLAKEIGANSNKIKDPRQVVHYLEENGIYPIARLVVYADPILGARRPDLSIKRPDGSQFVDTRGIRWPDPYNRKVWEYKVAVAKHAAEIGFKEIQFDYVRFPEHRIAGFNYQVPVEQRAGAIEDFLRYARQELAPLGVLVSADVFGLTTSVAPGNDMEIGQIYENIIEIVDYIKPMVYPSHYAPNTYGVTDPNQDPGRIVYESMVRAQKRSWGVPVQKHRPWIQDFTYGKKYVAADIEAQILGLAKAGIHQYILWDPSVRYTRNVNFDVARALSGQEPPWRREFQAEWARREEEHLARLQTAGFTLD